MHAPRPVPLDTFRRGVEAGGRKTMPGHPGTFWMEYEPWTVVRRPTFVTNKPDPAELRRAFRTGPTLVVNYQATPSEQYPGNAWLFLCQDPQYSLEKLAPPARRNVRRGQRELHLAFTSAQDIREFGLPAFRDHRFRHNLQGNHAHEFERAFDAAALAAGRTFIGAWKDHRLAAFLSIWSVDDWVEITGCYSMTDALPLRPNNTLMHFALSHYLGTGRCRLVSFGTSSIQEETDLLGLHRFKQNVGFEAVKVVRVFELHPSISRWTARRLEAVAQRLHHALPRLRWFGMVASTLRYAQHPKLPPYTPSDAGSP